MFAAFHLRKVEDGDGQHCDEAWVFKKQFINDIEILQLSLHGILS